MYQPLVLVDCLTTNSGRAVVHEPSSIHVRSVNEWLVSISSSSSSPPPAAITDMCTDTSDDTSDSKIEPPDSDRVHRFRKRQSAWTDWVILWSSTKEPIRLTARTCHNIIRLWCSHYHSFTLALYLTLSLKLPPYSRDTYQRHLDDTDINVYELHSLKLSDTYKIPSLRRISAAGCHHVNIK